ncbi:hypothetical protein [Spiroplasma endosymbiont of Virgichneumon dumeticola]|uniref:hypothetical protein n=1 Tax=Spiroplasma endosymbiont of Virgichneumon dumeticola TaxID=3139323 RepID=UPI0035C92555
MNQEDIELKNKNKFIDINIRNRFGLIISSFLISVSLLVSWIIWIDLYRNDINNILSVINKNLNFKFEFQELTIGVLIFATINIFSISIPFLFLKKRMLKLFFWV